MGLIKAGMGALGGTLADQWKEFFYCESMPKEVLVTKGQKRTTGRSSNTKGNDNIISNGSGIAVADGQCMIIVEQGKVVEVCAEPGEFTKRAFLNGRIDLSQAEAVIDIINAKNDYALKSSVNQLDGKLSEKIKNIREIILNNVAFIEAALDDPEHFDIDANVDNLKNDVENCLNNVDNLLKTLG